MGEHKKGGQAPSELIDATDQAVRRADRRWKSLAEGADARSAAQWSDTPEPIARLGLRWRR